MKSRNEGNQKKQGEKMKHQEIQKIARETIHPFIPEVNVDTASCVVIIDPANQDRFEYFSGAACTGEDEEGRLEYHADAHECINALIDAVIDKEIEEEEIMDKKISPDELKTIMRQLGYNPTHQGKEFAADLGITIHCLRKWLDKKHPSCLYKEKNGRLTIHWRGLEHLRAERKGKKQVINEKLQCAYCGGEFTEQLTPGNEGGRLTHTCPNGTKTVTPFMAKEDRERAVTPIIIQGEKNEDARKQIDQSSSRHNLRRMR